MLETRFTLCFEGQRLLAALKVLSQDDSEPLDHEVREMRQSN